MRTYEDFALASLQSVRGASFGIVDADLLRGKMAKLDSAIKQLGVDIKVMGQVYHRIDLTTQLQYIYFHQGWIEFYIENYPSDIFWVSDDLWEAVEGWRMDYVSWRKLYEEKSGQPAPPQVDPKDVPPPPPGSSPFPSIPVMPGGGIGTGTQLAVGVLGGVLLWAYMTGPKGPMSKGSK